MQKEKKGGRRRRGSAGWTRLNSRLRGENVEEG